MRNLSVLILAVLIGGQVFAGAHPERITGRDGAAMVLVAGGAFVMGAGDGLPDEGPPHRVEVPAFYIDVHEVTCARYAAFLRATGHAPPADWAGPDAPAGRENLPITNVTWFDAMRYAMWAGKRLPTEAEWEKAARGTDGRRFPWGNVDDPARRVIERDDRKKLEPVDSRPLGASPYGALHMAGNAYEWTADWYTPYPTSTHNSVQFGKKYKVFRGGGAEYYYGLSNRANTTARYRAFAYGAHDYIGFRCVQSVDEKHAPYDAKKAMDEAQGQLTAALKKPAELSHEAEYAEYIKAGRIPVTVVGAAGRTGVVRAGIPLPEGLVTDPAQLTLMAGDNSRRALQAKALSTYPDNSVRWALLTFSGSAGERLALDWRKRGEPDSVPALTIARNEGAIDIRTGAASLRCDRRTLLATHALLMRLEVSTEELGVLRPLAAEKVELGEAGPLHATMRLRGALGQSQGENAPRAFLYDLSAQAMAGSSRIRLLLTLTHHAGREKLLNVKAVDLHFVGDPGAAMSPVLVGTDRGAREYLHAPVELAQGNDLRFEVEAQGEPALEGTRAAGWIAGQRDGMWHVVAVPHFWQNHPASLAVTPQGIVFRMWHGSQPFDWEGGLAKTWEIIIDTAREQPKAVHTTPLRLSIPPAWSCGTNAIGAPLLPRGKEALERFPYWELLRETSMQQWARGMPTGLRHFGDGYMGGPYKGKNAYQNLEYDVAWNFVSEYLRTGDTRYIDAAVPMARHQADIDTNHFTGQPWKHSPNHTTTEAEFGHIFIRGLLLHYLLTGETRSLEVAREIGDWMAPRMARLEGAGNERQIGWSLYALTGLYEVTREQKYLDACVAMCNHLVARQSPTGQFTNIRWDNRIAFFNGITLNGMLQVYEHTKDEKLAQCIQRVADRTLGMYPEYACRTLNGYIWAARRTNDPRYLDTIERTWELATEYIKEPITEETHAWHFRAFAAKHDLYPLFATRPPAMPDPATWRGLRVEQPNVDVYVKPNSAAAPLMLIKEGHATGTAQLFDPVGRLLQTFSFPDANRMFEAVALTLPKADGPCLLRFTSGSARGWQVHYDASVRAVVHDAKGTALPDLFPRAYALLDDGATSISIRLEAMGEGFHAATLYDPAGNPVRTVRHFVDFEDPGRYELELKHESGSLDASGPWSVEVVKSKVIGARGLAPWWSPRAEELFHPEHP